MKKILVLMGALVLVPMFALADTVTIDPITLNGCGSQSVSISGTLVSTSTEEVGVWLGEDIAVHTLGNPQATSSETVIWNYGSKFLTVGNHEIFAEIITLAGVTDQTSRVVTIPVCQVASGAPSEPVVSHSSGSVSPQATTTVKKISRQEIQTILDMIQKILAQLVVVMKSGNME